MIRRIRIGLTLALGLLVVLEVLLPLGMSDSKPWWHHTIGYFALYGVLVCIGLVYGAKSIGKLGLQQPEPDPEAEARAPLDPADPPRAASAEGGAP